MTPLLFAIRCAFASWRESVSRKGTKSQSHAKSVETSARTALLVPTHLPAQPIHSIADMFQSTSLVPELSLLPTPPESQRHSPGSARAHGCSRSQMSASLYLTPRECDSARARARLANTGNHSARRRSPLRETNSDNSARAA